MECTFRCSVSRLLADTGSSESRLKRHPLPVDLDGNSILQGTSCIHAMPFKIQEESGRLHDCRLFVSAHYVRSGDRTEAGESDRSDPDGVSIAPSLRRDVGTTCLG
jgi:hypothetical protein